MRCSAATCRASGSCRSSCSGSPSAGAWPAAIEIDSDKPEVAALVTAVNHLLTRAGSAAEREATETPEAVRRPRRPHPRGGAGAPRSHPVRQPPVRQLRRRRSRRAHRPAPGGPGAAGVRRAGRATTSRGAWPASRPPSATRSTWSGLQAQVSRLEIASHPGRLRQASSALLITGVEIIPTQTVQALRPAADGRGRRSRSCWRWSRWPRRSSPPTSDGRITFMNPAAEQLTGSERRERARQAARGDRRAWSTRPTGACCRRPGAPGAHQRRAGEPEPPRAAAVACQRQRALHRAVRLADPQRRARS